MKSRRNKKVVAAPVPAPTPVLTIEDVRQVVRECLQQERPAAARPGEKTNPEDIAIIYYDGQDEYGPGAVESAARYTEEKSVETLEWQRAELVKRIQVIDARLVIARKRLARIVQREEQEAEGTAPAELIPALPEESP